MTAASGGARHSVLVTGAAGFIGSALCRRLVSAGHQVVGYDNLSRGRRDYLPIGVGLVEADIRDRQRLRAAISDVKPDCVIHLAAMHFIPDCIARPEETLEVNVEATRLLLDCCLDSPVRHFVFASTAAVYAPTDAPCVEGTARLGPVEIYGESKLAAEALVSAFHTQSGVATSILRLFNAVGRHETNPHVIPHIFESLQRSDTIELGNITPRRDYIDTRDVADATVAALDTISGLEILNVGTGVAWSVSDIVDALSRILGRRLDVVQAAARTRRAERMVLVADIGKTRGLTGWTARIGLDAALRDLVVAYHLQAEPHLAD